MGSANRPIREEASGSAATSSTRPTNTVRSRGLSSGHSNAKNTSVGSTIPNPRIHGRISSAQDQTMALPSDKPMPSRSRHMCRSSR